MSTDRVGLTPNEIIDLNKLVHSGLVEKYRTEVRPGFSLRVRLYNRLCRQQLIDGYDKITVHGTELVKLITRIK